MRYKLNVGSDVVTLATQDEIIAILETIKSRRESWYLSSRRKNTLTLAELGIDNVAVFDIIYDNLTWRDYVEGPEADNHVPPIPGNIWIFGLEILNHLCYLKFQDRPDRIVMWISIHEAEYPLDFPYK